MKGSDLSLLNFNCPPGSPSDPDAAFYVLYAGFLIGTNSDDPRLKVLPVVVVAAMLPDAAGLLK